MKRIGEYHAKWNKPIPKKQRLNVFSDKWMMIHNSGGGWEKNGGTLDYKEEKETVEGAVVWKMVEWDRYHYTMYMYNYINSMNLHCEKP